MAEFKEYPKWVVNADGVRVIVQNKAEEDKVTSAPKPTEKTKTKEKWSE